jgi:hypothetical protein
VAGAAAASETWPAFALVAGLLVLGLLAAQDRVAPPRSFSH